MEHYIIRAKLPSGFNPDVHVVTSFKRDNYEHFYLKLNSHYKYQGISAEASIHYTEGALLSMGDVEVMDYI